MLLGYSPYAHPGSINPFHRVFDSCERLDYTPPKNCDAILLWGGTDINPKYYGETPHPRNGYQPDSMRDAAEWSWMRMAAQHCVPIIGVCRGAQFLCAFAGGKLIQHMEKPHHGAHLVHTFDNLSFMMANDHHQSMVPGTIPNKLIAWYPGEDMTPEIVYFPKVRGLAIQGHPEWEPHDNPLIEYELDLVRKLIQGVL